MTEQRKTVGEEFERLVAIMARLRAKEGCPWDREQDLRSLRPYLIEESYEVLDEMDRVGYGGPWQPLCEELGDLLFQIVFHAQLGSEVGEFSMGDVCRSIAEKLERRHPHVFGTGTAKNSEQVLQNWAQLKQQEKKLKSGSEGSVLDGVPTDAPSLQRAERLTEKASRIGFDWPSITDVRAKLDEELRELDEAIAGKSRDALEHELGDVLFSLANLSRFIQTPPEDALRQANRRFTKRFQYIEAKLKEQNVAFGQATLEQMDGFWLEAKKLEKASAPLPRPLLIPAARLCTVELTVQSWIEATSFWDKVAQTVGWARTDFGAAARYADAKFELILHKGGERLNGVRLAVQLPSAEVLAAAASALQRLPDALKLEIATERVSFEDPAGARWVFTSI